MHVFSKKRISQIIATHVPRSKQWGFVLLRHCGDFSFPIPSSHSIFPQLLSYNSLGYFFLSSAVLSTCIFLRSIHELPCVYSLECNVLCIYLSIMSQSSDVAASTGPIRAQARSKMSAKRACDQCKFRKIKAGLSRLDRRLQGIASF